MYSATIAQCIEQMLNSLLTVNLSKLCHCKPAYSFIFIFNQWAKYFNNFLTADIA